MAGLLTAAPAFATAFSFACPPSCPDSDGAGRMLNSELLFDDATDAFAWTARFEMNAGQLPDGLWIVVSDGPEPDATTDGLAILYGDGASGRVSAYVYDRDAGRNSFEDPAGFIETFASALTFTDQSDRTRLLELALDATVINSFLSDPGWKGLRFAEMVGVWGHPTSGTEVDFDDTGRVLDYRHVGNTSYDRANRMSTVVPEPGTGLLVALGVCAMAFEARRPLRRPRRVM